MCRVPCQSLLALMTDNTDYLGKSDLLFTGAILLTVMTWLTVGKGLPLGEASVGPASRAAGSETKVAFKRKHQKHIFILNAV